MSDKYILTLDDLNKVKFEEMFDTLKMLNEEFGNEGGVIIKDRTLAIIRHALENSDSNEWIVITGKGHKSYQQNFSIPTSSDREMVMYVNNILSNNL